MGYFEQFLVIVVVHFLAVASPGPDFAIVLKQSIRYNRKVAMYTSLGIAAGIILHVTYSLVGIGLLIASDERLFTALKYIAAAYFCYIAWHCIRAEKPAEVMQEDKLTQTELTHPADVEQPPSAKKAFFTGFLINGLNVKATLFFVSLFSVVIAPDTPLGIKLIYGLYLVIATGSWFCFLSYLLTQDKVRKLLARKGYLFDRLMGVVLFILAIQLVLSDLS
ncbi:LysE family translocator [Colwellia sp. D2M02]|uniref:LysE family translocator n=1 Tax=Colwellia sp. D2M02 TaxID=2841562 RepID=UPI001C08D0F2|nr:LysE family translocator [Colwellia sp. D2M02]MBU2892975.1 LysE family translocator [Colwellia sp. D2M02]